MKDPFSKDDFFDRFNGNKKKKNSKDDPFRLGSDPFGKWNSKDNRDRFGREERKPFDHSSFSSEDEIEAREKAKEEARKERYTLYDPKRLRDTMQQSPFEPPKPTPKTTNAYLWVEDQAFHILDWKYGFLRHTDGAGRIVGKMEIKPFQLIIRPPDASIDILFSLMFSELRTFDGKLEFMHGDGINRLMPDVILHNTYVESVRFVSDYFEDKLIDAIELFIAPQYVESSGVVWEGALNPSRPIDPNPPGLLSRDSFEDEDNTLKILSGHYETPAGDRIRDLENGMVHLIIKCENGENKIVDVDLSDEKHDFLYEGKRLKDDKLIGLQLTGDTTTVVLEVVDQEPKESKE